MPSAANCRRFRLASGPGQPLPSGAVETARTADAAQSVRLAGMVPAAVAARLRHLPGLVFFDSAGHIPDSARAPISIIAARPTQILRGSIHAAADRAVLATTLAAAAQPRGLMDLPMGGLCGWVDYEGNFVFGDYPEMLVFRHDDASWWEIGNLSQALRESADDSNTDDQHATIGRFESQTPAAKFVTDVARIHDWIAAGDIYQVNLAHAFSAEVHGGSLFSLYQALRHASPAPMAAWLALDGHEILSSSPESFLRIDGREIETRPIKGTRPRSPDPIIDAALARELCQSPKECAELVMITDLLRNDLGQVCEFGSVSVDEMLHLESLAQVHHLVSTVTGQLRADVSPVDAMAACFPGGSITGAPKKRAMEIIRELECAPRGIYCGAIGYFGFNGLSAFNIAIRTLVRRGPQLNYHVGAGIVADSNAQQEYEETLHKAAGIRLATRQWQADHHRSQTDREFL